MNSSIQKFRKTHSKLKLISISSASRPLTPERVPLPLRCAMCRLFRSPSALLYAPEASSVFFQQTQTSSVMMEKKLCAEQHIAMNRKRATQRSSERIPTLYNQFMARREAHVGVQGSGKISSDKLKSRMKKTPRKWG
jgi:hypothetical protein